MLLLAMREEMIKEGEFILKVLKADLCLSMELNDLMKMRREYGRRVLEVACNLEMVWSLR